MSEPRLDPQLHTHFVIANATCDRTGKWYALNEYEMVRAVRYAGKVYQNEMARAVQQLGYGIRLMRQNGEITGFEIEGVSDALCERFSKRREEIERQIEKFEDKQGRKPTVKEIALITRETRPAALKEIATAEVVAFQRSQLSPEEWRQLQNLRSQAEAQTMPIQADQERKALRASISHLFERSSVLREHEILAEALNQSLGSLDLGRLKQAASSEESELVRVTDSPENRLLSECCTPQGLQLEQRTVKYVNDTRNSCPALNSHFVPAPHLSQEQKDAVTSILTTRDRVFSFRGVAGSGKTTTLREVRRGLSKAGHTVFAITPTTSAARVLRKEGFAQATTVEDLLRNAKKRDGLENAVVICDEAGLKSNRQGAELFRLAHKHNMRVLLVGDVRQHVSVEAGDFLRVLEAHSKLGRCQVQEIHRQIPKCYRAAVTQMAAGNVRQGLEELDRLNWISGTESPLASVSVSIDRPKHVSTGEKLARRPDQSRAAVFGDQVGLADSLRQGCRAPQRRAPRRRHLESRDRAQSSPRRCKSNGAGTGGRTGSSVRGIGSGLGRAAVARWPDDRWN